jgi:apolipoprotein D and lipocalin family protein
MKKLIPLLIPLMVSCASQPPLKKVDKVDINRFMGRWYVIANIPTFFEKGGINAVETYSWNEKEQRIDVLFQQEVEGKVKTYTQKAFVHDQSGSEWRIQFFWPLKFPYLIIDLAEDYSYTVIGVPNRSYVWIMAREKSIPDEIFQRITEKLKKQHYEISKILKVPQK